MPVVIGSGGGGVLFHEACGHGLEADLVGKGASVFRAGSASRSPSPLVTLVDDGTMARRVGLLRHRRRGPPRPAQRAHRGRRPHRLHVGLPAGPQGGPGVSSGNGRRQSYQHLPMVRMTNTYLLDGTDDARRHRRLHRARRVRHAPRRRPGQHRHRRLRVRHDRGVPDRGRRDHRAAARGQPHRQRPRGARATSTRSATTSPWARPAPAARTARACPSATASRPCGCPASPIGGTAA